MSAIKNHDALLEMKVSGPAILSQLLALDLNTKSGHSWKHDTSNCKEVMSTTQRTFATPNKLFSEFFAPFSFL